MVHNRTENPCVGGSISSPGTSCGGTWVRFALLASFLSLGLLVNLLSSDLAECAESFPPKVESFRTEASKGPVKEETCEKHDGDVISLLDVDSDPGKSNKSLRKEPKYVLVDRKNEDIKIIRHKKSQSQFYMVGFQFINKKESYIEDKRFSACIWKIKDNND